MTNQLERLKALTISQPFASLIASGEKWVENRCWYTHHRGPLAIHAGSGQQYLGKRELAAYPTRQIVAVGVVVTCLARDEIEAQSEQNPLGHPRGVWGRCWREICEHKHCEGPYCWILADVRPVTPIEIRGAMGLWDLPDDVSRQLLAEWRAAQ